MILRPPLAKYAKTAEMQATSQLGDGPLVAVDYVVRLLRVVILLALWRTVLGGRGEVSGMTLAAVLTYTLIAEVFAQQLDVTTRIEDTMWEGTLASRFLRPMGIVGQFGAQLVGDWAFSFTIFSLPLLALSPLLGVSPFPASPAHGAVFLVSLALAVTIGVAVDFFFAGFAALVNQNIWQVKHVRRALATVLSGALIPLQLLPWGLGAIFAWLPFASMASAPLRIYTGTGDPLPLIALQLFWAATLWPLSIWMWTTHREKLTVFGG